MRMHAITGAWEALPEIPWETQGGTSYKDLGRRAARVLADLCARAATEDPVELALLADQVADLRVDLRDLAQTQLSVNGIYAAGQASVGPPPRSAARDWLRLV
jgi:hypothetical protein